MKPNVRSKLEEVFGFPFFRSVGPPLPASVTPVKNWAGAAKMCRSYKWETCQLMARNALQRKIQLRYPEDKVNHFFWYRMQEWGPLSDELRPLILSIVDNLLWKFPLQNEAHKSVRDAISWDIMAICIEQEYQDLVEPFFYIPVVGSGLRMRMVSDEWRSAELRWILAGNLTQAAGN